MALIKSISGIRGTIGGKTGDNLTLLDVVKFTAAYGTLILQQSKGNKKIVVGRDGRISGAMVKGLVVSTLNSLGIDVVDLDYSTTPTVEMAVVFEKGLFCLYTLLKEDKLFDRHFAISPYMGQLL